MAEVEKKGPMDPLREQSTAVEIVEPAFMRLWTMRGVLHSGLYELIAARAKPVYSSDPSLRRWPLVLLGLRKCSDDDQHTHPVKKPLSVYTEEIPLNAEDADYWKQFQRGALKLRTRISKLETIVKEALIPLKRNMWTHIFATKKCRQLESARSALGKLMDRVHACEEQVEVDIYGAAAKLAERFDEEEIRKMCDELQSTWDGYYGLCASLLGAEAVIGSLEGDDVKDR